MTPNLLRRLCIRELRDLYSAESQLVKALPKLANAAALPGLRAGLESHLRQTRGRMVRLKRIFKALEESPKGGHCKSMEVLIKEGSEAIGKNRKEADARLVAAAWRVARYAMTRYGCARTYATFLGENEAARLLEKSLNEEKQMDANLNELSESALLEVIELGDSSLAEEGFRKYLAKSARTKQRQR